jgi:membrane-bound lytic murein transglycosylase A
MILAKLLCRYFIVLLLISACSYSTSKVIRGKGNLKLQRVEYSKLAGWNMDDHKKALKSFLNSCKKFAKMKSYQNIGNKIGNIRVSDFRDVCHIGDTIKYTSSRQIKNFFENWFVPFQVSSRSGNEIGKFTGYFEPLLEGSLVKDEIYKYPVYARPENPYKYSRKQIDSGALDSKGLELLYVRDRVDLFFMHIQGTGRIRLRDGDILKLSYDGKNDFPYKSIGKYMINGDVIASGDYSYDSIKSWLRNNYNQGKKIMNLNQSYIYFKVADSDDVIGAQTVPLTAQRSLAIDKDLLPYGYPIWLEVRAKNSNRYIYNKLLVTQDTGSAIKGPVRGDIFFGSGKKYEKAAAKMNNNGSYYIFLPANAVSNLI